MRIVDVRERSVPISRYRDPHISSGGLTTSIVAVTTGTVRNGKPIAGYGFSSFGRYAQSGLIRERFAPRLLQAGEFDDPRTAWGDMMRGEKAGGHGERCVAIGTLDMALWDAAAKIAGVPLYRYVANVLGEEPATRVETYASGGYPYPKDDLERLAGELREGLDLGFTRFKIKIGQRPLDEDLRRIEFALGQLPKGSRLAVDAMNAYGADEARAAARALEGYGLWWFEDVCDPLDFQTQAEIARLYSGPIAAGEALFSAAEAKLLDAYGGLRRERDILLFDPVHCYGLPGYLQIVDALLERGWNRSAFWPHGGHLFALHVARALRLGGAEVNPFSFQPFGGPPAIPEVPGIGFETQPAVLRLFEDL